MTATDELRRLLDERGVEWTSGDTEVSRNKYTHFCPDAGMSIGVWESGDGKLGIDAHTDYRFTPAQAITATLGAGTCHDKNGFDPETGFECTVCGAMVERYMVTPADTGHEVQFNFCPNCGRRLFRL